MYTSIIKAISFAALVGISSVQGVEMVIKNNCGSDVTVGSLTNGQPDPNFIVLPKGGSKTFTHPENWGGRYWGRNKCSGDKCKEVAGAASPASLAEVTFAGYGGSDFYDLSFVDGFNLPMSMAPINPSDAPGAGGDPYRCAAPKCAKIPSCPNDMKVFNGANQLVGCKSACSKYGKDEFCCAGAHNTPETCPPNEYSKAVEAQCPDAYSYAYDDNTSTFTCKASGYTVTFCP